MPLRFLYENIFALLVGNIASIGRLIQKDKDLLWKSRFRIHYQDKGAGILIVVFAMLLSGVGYFLVINTPSFVTVFFFTAGVILLTAIPHYFDQIYLYPDRIEIRCFLYTYKTIPFENVIFALRDTLSQSAVHVLYKEGPWGYAYSARGIDGVWFLPVEFFKKGHIKLKPEKIHPNIYVPFETIKSHLPEVPIKHPTTPLLKRPKSEIVGFFSLLIINPFAVMVLLTSIYGLTLSPLWYFISIVLSTELTKKVYAYSVSSDWYFDETLVREK